MIDSFWQRRAGYAAAVGAAALSATFALVMQGTEGAGITPDSIHYLHAANRLSAGDRLVDASGRDFTLWPPLYPALIAAVMLVTGADDPRTAAGWLNAGSFAATAAIAAFWLWRRIDSLVIRCWGVIATACAPVLSWVSYYVWSESLFILLTVGGLLAADQYLRSGRRSLLALAAAGTAAACLTRYIGTVMIVPTALLLVMCGASWRAATTEWTARIRRGAAYAALAVFPVALWMTYNLTRSVSPAGARHASERGWLEIAVDLLDSASDVMLLSQIVKGIQAYALSPWSGIGEHPAAAGMIWSVIIGLGALTAAYAFFMMVRTRPHPGSAFSLLLLCGFAMYYVAALAVLQKLVATDAIDFRLLAPFYVPAVLAAALLLDHCRFRFRYWRAISFPGLLLSAATLLIPALYLLASVFNMGLHMAGMRDFDRSAQYGATTSGDLARAVQERIPEGAGPSYSNDNMALYVIADDLTAYCRLKERRSGLQGAYARWQAGGQDVWIVWFDRPARALSYPYEYDRKDLDALPAVDTIAEFNDGALLRFSALNALRPGSQPVHSC